MAVDNKVDDVHLSKNELYALCGYNVNSGIPVFRFDLLKDAFVKDGTVENAKVSGLEQNGRKRWPYKADICFTRNKDGVEDVLTVPKRLIEECRDQGALYSKLGFQNFPNFKVSAIWLRYAHHINEDCPNETTWPAMPIGSAELQKILAYGWAKSRVPALMHAETAGWLGIDANAALLQWVCNGNYQTRIDDRDIFQAIFSCSNSPAANQPCYSRERKSRLVYPVIRE